jgi:hypothetical protein
MSSDNLAFLAGWSAGALGTYLGLYLAYHIENRLMGRKHFSKG